MSDQVPKAAGGSFSGFVTVGKDFVSLLRDGALVVLALMLVAFPAKFNLMLENAGFKEGNIAGFKWTAEEVVHTDDSLRKANETIADLQLQNDNLLQALKDAQQQATDTELSARVEDLEASSRVTRARTVAVQREVTETLITNKEAVMKAKQSIKSR